MTTTTSPVTLSSAALTADWWPKLRDKERATIHGSWAAASVTISKVRSELPSSTNIISCGPPGILSKTRRTRRRSSGMTRSSLVNRDCHRNAKATAHLLAFPFITLYKPNELGHFGDGKQVFIQFLSSHRSSEGDVGVAMAV